NSHGSVTSSNATLTVLVPAAITAQPTNQSVILSNHTAFTVFVIGTAPLSYRWYFYGAPLTDGNGITGSTTTTLNLSNVQTSEAGSYQFIATNNYGSATSAVAMLTVYVPAAIALQPTNEVALLGSTASFSATVAGTGPLTYQWQENGTNLADVGRISGSATPTLTISNVQMSDVGSYQLLASNAYGPSASTNASLLVVPLVAWGDNIFGESNAPSATTSALTISAGDYHNLALRSDGTVIGWGDYYVGYTNYGPVMVPSGLTNAVSVSASGDFDLALRADGTVLGWGTDDSGQLDVPTGLTNDVAIATGAGFCLALRADGTVVEWGGNINGLTNVPAGLSNVVAIAAGFSHCLALRQDGTVVGFGYNVFGETIPPAGLSNVVAIAAGYDDSLALRGDGTVVAWGQDTYGETNVPAGLGNVVAIAAGFNHCLALQNNGKVVAWGGDNSFGETNVPAQSSNAVAIAAGGYHSLALVQNPASQVPPTIWWQGPTNRIVTPGQAAIFNPYVQGSLPMSFQWFFNGAPLAGQTNRWLVVDSLQTNQAGNYSFIVSNDYGSVTSAVVVVSESPAISIQPSSLGTFGSGNVTFTVAAAGQAPLSYQWYFNGVPLTDGGGVSGSATATLSIQNVQSASYGNYQVVVSNPWGSVSSSMAVLSPAVIHFVNVNNGSPISPYTNWASAAQTIQQAVDASFAGDEILVTNGTYSAGARIVYGAENNRVVVDRPVLVQSVNGPQVTIIQGASATRCAYLTNAAALIGFTLEDGRTLNTNDWYREQSGGGVWCSSQAAIVSNCVITLNYAHGVGGGIVSGTLISCTLGGNQALEGAGADSANLVNCVLSGNSATWGGGAWSSSLNNCTVSGNTARDPGGTREGEGGGAYSCNITNCILTGNTARVGGGGAAWGMLVNCLVANNSALQGGGASAGTVINCTVVGNSAPSDGGVGGGVGGGLLGGSAENSIIIDNSATFGAGDFDGSSLTYCLSSSNPGGAGNITGDPIFINYAGGDYRLQSNSPCINTGSNGFVTTATDLDGNPRIVDGVVDMGAYQYQHIPWFLVLPTNQIIVVGSNLVLTATVLGDPSVDQWYFNGTPLADGGRILGSASNTLTIAMTVTNDSGNYWMIASNSYGVATSVAAAVTVRLAVSIAGEPTNQTVLSGRSTSFTVTANGFVPPNYLWYSNGIAMANGGRISGATSPTMTIANTQTNDDAAYQVIVTNIYGSATSSVATLTVIAPAQIIGQPASQDALLGTNVAFIVIAGGTGPFSYQWYFDGAPLSDGGRISGSATPALNISNVQSSDAGGYRVVVSNLLSSATSLTASLTPQAIPGPSAHYVMLTSTNPQSPYLDWSTAATNIQDAIDAAVAGDSIVVSNGIYNSGGRLVYGTNAVNRVVINKPVAVESLGGPAVTTIAGLNTSPAGYHPGRCVYMTNGAFLTGFTLASGGASTIGDVIHEKSGGAAWCEATSAVISNCVIFNNSAAYGYGGGVFGGTVLNCLLATNLAGNGGAAASNTLLNCSLKNNRSSGVQYGTLEQGLGGGAFYSTLSNCVIVANSSLYGGGTYGGLLFNCVLKNNSGSSGAGAYSNILYNCILENNLARGEGGG
ncbi:MAG TPA: immunoglobulin domain-containing protein, partial [Candidatus Acidoferrum sp.]|nr:immunoglobulin domain-containing protein [Candidatus Acidoferrum sp.]